MDGDDLHGGLGRGREQGAGSKMQKPEQKADRKYPGLARVTGVFLPRMTRMRSGFGVPDFEPFYRR
jgi:hypothetical protein